LGQKRFEALTGAKGVLGGIFRNSDNAG